MYAVIKVCLNLPPSTASSHSFEVQFPQLIFPYWIFLHTRMSVRTQTNSSFAILFHCDFKGQSPYIFPSIDFHLYGRTCKFYWVPNFKWTLWIHIMQTCDQQKFDTSLWYSIKPMQTSNLQNCRVTVNWSRLHICTFIQVLYFEYFFLKCCRL